MTVAKFLQPNFTTQSAAVYKAAIDAAIQVLQSIGGDFAPHAMDSPNMQIVIDAGRIFKPGGTLVSIGQQITGSLVAPVSNPRIDRVVIDSESGVYSVLTGTESISPVVPSITNGKLPCCQIAMTVGQTTIANSIITDERTTYSPLARLMRMPVEAINSTTGGFVREILLVDRGILFDCDCSNGPITISLPDTAQAGNGFMIGVIKTDPTANAIILVPSTTGESFPDGVTKTISAQNGAGIVTTDGLGQWVLAFDSSRTYDNVTLTGTTTAGAINAAAVTASALTVAGLITGNGALTVAGLITATAGQIKFPATQNPSADANTLDDYEEGTWTPSADFGGATTGWTISGVGKYTKIGRLVTAAYFIQFPIKGSAVGVARLTGLPFSSLGTNGLDDGSPGGAINRWVSMLTALVYAGLRLDATTTTTNCKIMGAAAAVATLAQLTDAHFQAGSTFEGTLTYYSA